MIVYFSIYTFLGYLMESGYISLLQRHFISSGLLKGPFIPLYGIGACCLIVFSPYLTNPLLMFFVGGMSMTLLEYIASLYIEKVFHTQCWNYSHHYLHFQGRICLLYFIMWCFLSYFFISSIHPYMMSIVPINDLTILFSLIYCAFLSKAFLDRFQDKDNQRLIQNKNKESNDSLS